MFCCTSIFSSTTRSATLVSSFTFPRQSYSKGLFDGLSPPDSEGFSSFPLHLLHHAIADTPPVRTAASDSFQSVLVAFARCGPSQPPEFSCYEATSTFTFITAWCIAHIPFLDTLLEGFIVLLSRHDASQATRLEPFTSVGLPPTRCSVLSLDTPTSHLF